MNNNHWISTCLCNPWFFLLQYYKNQVKDKTQLSEKIENLENNDYIHGFLMFDPMTGFVKEEDISYNYCILCDSYIWLMNMASHYQDCEFEETLKYIDFKMHILLQRDFINRWWNQFDVDKSVWDSYLLNPNEDSEEVPQWFIWVTEWFMYGLNGPFGTVSVLAENFLSSFYKEDL